MHHSLHWKRFVSRVASLLGVLLLICQSLPAWSATSEAERLARQGHLLEARNAFARSLSAAQERRDQSEVGIQALRLGQVVQSMGDLLPARQLYYEAAQNLGAPGQEYPFGRALVGLADIARLRGEIPLAEGLYQRVFREVDDPFLQEMAARQLARLYISQGAFSKAVALLEPRVGDAQQVLSRPDQMRSLSVLEMAYDWMGQKDDVERIRQRQQRFWQGWLRFRKESGSPQAGERGQMERGMALWKSGDPSSGRRVLNQVLRDLQRGEDWHALSMALQALGDIALDQGDHRAAGRYYRKAEPVLEQIGSLWRKLHWHQRQARVAEEKSDWEAAVTQYIIQEKLIREAGIRSFEPLILLQHARVLVALGQEEKAVAKIRQALHGCAEQKNVFCQVAALYQLAQRERASGDVEMARFHWQEGERLANRLGLSTTARLRLQEGRDLPGYR